MSITLQYKVPAWRQPVKGMVANGDARFLNSWSPGSVDGPRVSSRAAGQRASFDAKVQRGQLESSCLVRQ